MEHFFSFYFKVLDKETGLFYTRFSEPGATKTLIIAIGGVCESIALGFRLPLLHFLWRKRSWDMWKRFVKYAF